MEQSGDDFTEQKLLNLVNQHSWEDIDALPKKSISSDSLLGIGIPPTFQSAHNRFSYLLQKNQLSHRAMALTAYLLDIDTNNYYALMLRKNSFLHLKIDPSPELRFLNYLLTVNSKSYHLWAYKRILAEKVNYEGEYQFVEDLLKEDMNNYHVWGHKIWLTSALGNYEAEWETSNKSRQSNFRVLQCNSYWSYRMFLFKMLGRLESKEAILQEIKCGMQILRERDTNECIWNYINGFFNQQWNSDRTIPKYEDFSQLKQMCSSTKNRFGQYTLFLILKRQGETKGAKEILEILKDEDRTRVKYYQFCLQQFES